MFIAMNVSTLSCILLTTEWIGNCRLQNGLEVPMYIFDLNVQETWLFLLPLLGDGSTDYKKKFIAIGSSTVYSRSKSVLTSF